MRDRAAAESWIRSHLPSAEPIAVARERPWSTVARVPFGGGVAWFKACGAVQAFEPRLTADLSHRWHDRVTEVIAFDEQRAWLLLADAGTALRERGNPPEAWLRALPMYAELQAGEAEHAERLVMHGVPALTVTELPSRYLSMLEDELPLTREEHARMEAFASPLEQLCAELDTAGLRSTVQHDDLHMGNVYERDGYLRVLDWGDSSISHPFFSLVVTLRFLEEVTGLEPGDPWFDRLRDAYLEPWGEGLEEAFVIALRVGRFAHAIAWARQRSFLSADSTLQPDRATFDTWFAHVLRRALEVT